MLPGAISLYSAKSRVAAADWMPNRDTRVLTANLPDEAYAQLHKRETVALRLGQVGKLCY